MNMSALRRSIPSIAVAIASMALVSTLIVRTSDAAFTATVSNPANSFQSGRLALSIDAVGALFNVPALEPGQVVEECLVVTYGGDIPDPEPVVLRTLASGQLIGDAALASWLQLRVEEGPAGAGCGFAPGSGTQLLNAGETLAQFAANRGTYATGARGFDPSPPSGDTARAYRFTVTLDPNTPDTIQNLTLTSVEFIWEINS